MNTQNMTIRLFKESDAMAISNIICRNLREVNYKDYSCEEIEKFASFFTPSKVIEESKNREKMFVAESKGILLGTASLVRDNRTKEEKYVCLTVFVLPESHGLNIGKRLMQQVEEAAKVKRAKEMQVPASLTALDFYKKLGYKEISSLEDGHIWMHKKLK